LRQAIILSFIRQFKPFYRWEIKGVCSFLLIAFYRNRYLPVKNAFKAISYYRTSDVALMLCMWMMHHLTHQNITFDKLGEAKTLAVQSGNTGMAIFIVCMMILPAAIKSAVSFTPGCPGNGRAYFFLCYFHGSLSTLAFFCTAYASFGGYAVGKIVIIFFQ
jgi:hypothetical protein